MFTEVFISWIGYGYRCYLVPGITFVTTRFITIFLYGVIGKGVAEYWKEETYEYMPESLEIEWMDKNL